MASIAPVAPVSPLAVSMGSIPEILEEYANARSEELYDRREVIHSNINTFVNAVIACHPSNLSIRGLQSLQEEFSTMKDAPEKIQATRRKIMLKMVTFIKNIRASETGIDIATGLYRGSSRIYEPLSVKGYTPGLEEQATKVVKSTSRAEEEELRKENQELRNQVQELASQRKIEADHFDTVLRQLANKLSELTAEIAVLKAEIAVSRSVVSPSSVAAAPAQQSS